MKNTNFKKTIKLELTLEELNYVTEMCENDLIDFEDKIENKLYDNEMYTDEDYENLKLLLESCKKVHSKLVNIYNKNLHD